MLKLIVGNVMEILAGMRKQISNFFLIYVSKFIFVCWSFVAKWEDVSLVCLLDQLAYSFNHDSDGNVIQPI